MKQPLVELFARIAEPQEEIEEEFRQRRDEFVQRCRVLAGEFLRQQRRYKTGSTS